jgi:ubiquinone/menaquinone biosynthesis C-methylase UbiE
MLSHMSLLPKPWTTIGRHALLPEAGHDEVARFNSIAHLNAFLAQRLVRRVRDAYEHRAAVRWRMKHGAAPTHRHEVAEALAGDPAYRSWSTLRRQTMEMRQQYGRALVQRQAQSLAERAAALNDAPTLRLDPSLEIPRHVASVDVHLMPGGYTGEQFEGDVGAGASYDAGMYATLGGGAGPWNDGAGRALAGWLRRKHPDFRPRRIVDLGCGVGHNTLPIRALYPEAEVIAIDVAAPMLRYGHARARARGVDDVQFWQQDAKRTSLESHSCDLVYTTMVLHETSRDALARLFHETRRLLRPGGLTLHLEQPPYRGLPPFEQFMRDWDGRYNNEPFWSALHSLSLPDALEAAGFARAGIFESACRLPSVDGSSIPSRAGHGQEDFGRAPRWYLVGAWQAVQGSTVNGAHGTWTVRTQETP